MNRSTFDQRLLSERDGLLRFIRSRGVPADDAEDILHDSLLKALRAAPELRNEDRLISWLYQIVRNVIADHFRRQGSEIPSEGDQPLEAPSHEHLMLCQCVASLAETLAPGYGEVIEAIDLQGESTTSAAARMGISRNNLKVRLHRARAQLRQRLVENCRTCAVHGCLDCACR